MAAELVRQLTALGVQNHVLLLDNAGRADRQILAETAGSLAGSAVLPCQGALDRQTFRALGRYLAEHDIDLMHSHKYKTSFYALPVCRWQGRAVLSTYHNWVGGSGALRFYNALDQRLARFNHLAVGVSTPVMQVLRQRMPAARCQQIDNGIDTQRFLPMADRSQAKLALGLKADTLVLGCVGRLSQEKGIGRLLEALAVLANERRSELDWLLLLAGDGDFQAALQAQAQAVGLGERVRFLGRRSDTPALYAAMDVYLLPSLLEAFPMALLEAMTSGCAVVAADVGEVRRMLDDGRAGRIVPAGIGAQPWIDALRPVLAAEPAERAESRQMAAAAAERVQAHYSSQAMARRYLQAYEVALQHSRRRSTPR